METYIKEGIKKDAERVMKGMKKWEWRGLKEGLRKMGLLGEIVEMEGAEDKDVEESSSAKKREKEQ